MAVSARASDVATDNRRAGLQYAPRRFRFSFAYFFGEGAGLVASFFAPLPAFTSMSVADIVYVTVTFSPTFRSPVTFVLASRLISQRSFPFWTAIIESVTSSTGPVTWYVFPPAAKAALLNARLAAANKLSGNFIFMCRLDSRRLFVFKRFRNPEETCSGRCPQRQKL